MPAASAGVATARNSKGIANRMNGTKRAGQAFDNAADNPVPLRDDQPRAGKPAASFFCELASGRQAGRSEGGVRLGHRMRAEMED